MSPYASPPRNPLGSRPSQVPLFNYFHSLTHPLLLHTHRTLHLNQLFTMQLILVTLLLSLSLAITVPSFEEAPAAEETIISPNSCAGVCDELSYSICGKNADGAFTIFDNACLLRKANCDGLSFVQVPREECSDTQV